MDNNKVSEKAIWEGFITSDESPMTATQMRSQPQMMFCYKCNNVIPDNSKFCPCCKIELYTVCPKCGVKYSTQYQICNQCGTDRQEYLQLQKKEQERIERLKREERIRQEKLEREQREAQQRQEELWQQELEAFEHQNNQIINTNEYQSTYSILKEALENTRWKHVLCMFNTGMREHLIRKYIKKKGCEYDQYMLDYVLDQINWSYYQYTYDVLNDLSKLCLTAYKKKNGLPITFEEWSTDNYDE